MRKKELLKRATEHYFSTGIDDGTSRLCRANMIYGLAKIHQVQEKLGFKSDATFISTPDETITRNTHRWKAGFGYGGKLSWGTGKEKMVMLDTKPNACGMIVGGLQEIPDIGEFIQRINGVKGIDLYIDNIKIDWDLYTGNHFIDFFEVDSKSEDFELPDYAFMIHSSASELKGETDRGVGLYINRSESLRNNCLTLETEFGDMHVLLDSDAEEYFRFYKYAEKFAEEKRSKISEALFDQYEEICNVNHQGLLNYNEHLLGCQSTQDNHILPIALRSDLPAFLMEGKDNLGEDIINSLGFKRRGDRLGVTHRLSKANILPHGGGYNFNDVLDVKKVLERKGERYFVLDMKSGMGTKVCSEVRDLPYYYRGKDVVLRSVKLGMGKVIAHLIPCYTFKI
ncbi:MAG: hypothetical protein ACOC6H_00355 [Thermoproteota archaeon]